MRKITFRKERENWDETQHNDMHEANMINYTIMEGGLIHKNT